jgi:hypothetical protein
MVRTTPTGDVTVTFFPMPMRDLSERPVPITIPNEIAHLAIAANDLPIGWRRQRHEAHLLGSAPYRVVRRI